MAKVIELLANLEFSSYLDVVKRLDESEGKRIYLGENLYLEFDFEYIGFIVRGRNGDRPCLVCPVKDCPLYTGGGHVCSEHFVDADMRPLFETLPFFNPLREKFALIHNDSSQEDPADQFSKRLFRDGIITSEDIAKLLQELQKEGCLSKSREPAETDKTDEGESDDDNILDKELEFQSEELGVHVTRSPAFNRSLTVSTLDGLLQFHTCADPECTKVGVMRSAFEYFCPPHNDPAPKSSRVQTMSEMHMTVASAWKKANPGISLSEFKTSADYWINMLAMIRKCGPSGYTRRFNKSGGVITLFLSDYMQFNYKSRMGGRRMYICSQPFCFGASVSKHVVADWRQYMCKHHADSSVKIIDPHLAITEPYENWLN